MTGQTDDIEHWQKLVHRDPEHLRRMFGERWEANGHQNFFTGPKDCLLTDARSGLSWNPWTDGEGAGEARIAPAWMIKANEPLIHQQTEAIP